MRRWLLLALLLLVSVTACSGNQPIKPWGDLHMPGVKKIPGIEALQPLSAVARVYDAATYQSRLDGNETHVLFENGQTVYDMRLDGSQLHPLTLPCSESVAIAPGGVWIACRTNTDIVFHDLTNRYGDFTLTGAGQYPGLPSWAPDGQHFAAVTDLGGGCSIGVFDVSFAAGSTNLVALLSLPQFVERASDYVGCSVGRLAWSPDGTQLAFIDVTFQRVYDLPIDSLHVLTRPRTSPPITKVIERDDLIRLGDKCCLHSGLAWTASSTVLTYVDHIGRNIKQADIMSHDVTTLLAQNAAGVFGLSWTPDGKHLVFVLGIASDELTPPPSQIYVYTPSEA
jgi:WD40-like Beta Propeller Repeat